MTTLVTGGAGFLGSHVVDALLARNQTVICLDDLSGGDRRNLNRGTVFVEGSITDEALVDRLFEEHKFEHVFHLAAYAAEGLSHFIRRFNYTNNVLGSVHLINAAIRHETRRFVFTSSIAVYGRGDLGRPFVESDVPRPIDPYGIAKLAVEQDLHAAHDMFGLEYTIFRPHNVYGERQNVGDRYRNVVGIFMRQLLEGGEMTVFGDGEQTRAFTFVGDIAPAIAGCVQMPQTACRTYNAGSDDVHTVRELAAITAAALGMPCRLRHVEARHEAKHAASDHSEFRRAFGLVESTPLEEGIARMAEWVRRVGVTEAPRFSAIEIERMLPPIWRR